MNRTLLVAVSFLVFAGPSFCQAVVQPAAPAAPAAATESATPDAPKTVLATGEAKAFHPLTENWEAASFGGEGAIEFKTLDVNAKPDTGGDSEATKVSKTHLIEMAMGDPLTGVRWTGPLTRDHYELRLKARRVEGFDFFVAVTFPVAEEHCSLVVGGWGGGILGISSIDGNDAANNETTQFKDFKTGQWYAFRIRVDKEAVRCWIDEEEWVNVDRDDHSFDIRIEMDPCLPLGIANFQCVSEIKDVEIRTLATDAK